jgi:hypothetical protein
VGSVFAKICELPRLLAHPGGVGAYHGNIVCPRIDTWIARAGICRQLQSRDFLVFHSIPGLVEIVQLEKIGFVEVGQYQHPPTVHWLSILIGDVGWRETSVRLFVLH